MAKYMSPGRSFLLWYAHDLMNFRLQELHAITACFNIKFEWLEEPSVNDPFLLVNFASSADVLKIMSRTVLIRSAYELWAKSNSISTLHEKMKALPESFIKPYTSSKDTFRILVESFGKKLDKDYKVQRIDELAFLPLEGRIKLKDPDHSFLLMEYYGANRSSSPEDPFRLFFGRWIADGQRTISQKISLKTRKFIGNTSMDPLLSLVMANMACVKKGSLILDPFVGSGGLLVAAAHFGGLCFGTDIDYLMLHGRAKPSRVNQKRRAPDESILLNMKQYGLESHFLDAIVSDFALPLWRVTSLFDAIVTDPPYGIREPTERIGSGKDYKIPDNLAHSHIPCKVTYSLQELIEDLLDFSSIYLRLHGRLVYWMPAFNEDFDQKKLPYHPCLELKGFCEQPLTCHSSRYLITMQKTKENVNESEKAYVCDTTLSFRKKYFGAHKKRLEQ